MRNEDKERAGNRPQKNSGFHYLMRYDNWLIYVKDDGGDYVNFKFVFDGVKTGKANYNIAYMRSEQRFTNQCDKDRLFTDFPIGIPYAIFLLGTYFDFHTGEEEHAKEDIE